ncbi:hypothetical protein V8G54_033275, partial [Vigna mungo]
SVSASSATPRPQESPLAAASSLSLIKTSPAPRIGYPSRVRVRSRCDASIFSTIAPPRSSHNNPGRRSLASSRHQQRQCPASTPPSPRLPLIWARHNFLRLDLPL